MFTTMKFISKHEDTRIYGATIPDALTNQALLDSKAYKTYYAFAFGEETPKPKYIQKKVDSDTTTKQKPAQASKGTRLKSPAKVAKSRKKKTPSKKPKAKGLDVLSEAALSEVEQLKLVTKRSRKDFHSSHAIGSGEGVDTRSKVPDEQQQKIIDTDEGTGITLGVPGVPKDDSESDKEYWGKSDEDSDEEEVKDDDVHDDDDETDDDDDSERTESENMGDDNPDPILSTHEEKEEEEEKEPDERVHTPQYEQTDDEEYDEEKQDEEMVFNDEEEDELYSDLNINLQKRDVEMTDVVKEGEDQHTSSQETTFKQHTEDAHDTGIDSLLNPNTQSTTLVNVPVIVATKISPSSATPIPSPPTSVIHLQQQQESTLDPTTTTNPTTSVPTILDFASLFKFETWVSTLERDLSEFKQTNQFASAISSIPDVVDAYIANKMQEVVNVSIQLQTNKLKEEAQAENQEFIDQVDTSMKFIIKEEVKSQLSKTLKKKISDVTAPLIDQKITETLEGEIMFKSSHQPQTTYEAAASLLEFELTKMLIDKIESNKSINQSDEQKELYNALANAYNTYKDLLDTYGDVLTLKRGHDSKEKESKSTRSTKGSSRSQPTSTGKSAQAEEHVHTVGDMEDPPHQEFDMRFIEEQPEEESSPNAEWYKKPTKIPTVNRDWNKTKYIDYRPSQQWISKMAQAENPPTSFDELIDTPIDFTAYVMHRLNITNLTQELLNRTEGEQYPHDLSKPLPLVPDERGRLVIPLNHFINNDLEYLKEGSSSRRYTTSITKIKVADYGQVKLIEDRVSRDDKLFKFKEGDFYRLCIQDIEDMLLLLVQQKLSNLTVEERYALNVALRMYTRRIVIKRPMEDLQLCVESYQKKLNLSKRDTFRPDLKRRTVYTAYSNPQRIIYVDYNNKNRLMRTDELHKFNDGTLNDVRTALNGIASGIKMEYLPKNKWSKINKQRARVMIQEIDHKLRERRIMRRLETFVDSHHGPSDAMHNPSQPFKVEKTLASKLTEITLISINLLTPSQLILKSEDGNPSSVNIKQHCGIHKDDVTDNQFQQSRHLLPHAHTWPTNILKASPGIPNGFVFILTESEDLRSIKCSAFRGKYCLGSEKTVVPMSQISRASNTSPVCSLVKVIEFWNPAWFGRECSCKVLGTGVMVGSAFPKDDAPSLKRPRWSRNFVDAVTKLGFLGSSNLMVNLDGIPRVQMASHIESRRRLRIPDGVSRAWLGIFINLRTR
ncbi:hypothetical protein Tco_1376933 [Tanacetum coccineum]